MTDPIAITCSKVVHKVQFKLFNADLAHDNNGMQWCYCELRGGLGTSSKGSECGEIFTVQEDLSIRR